MLEYDNKFTRVEDTQDFVANTVNDVFNVVTSTMGPDGQVVVIQDGTAVKTTKDGATVARSLEFKNVHQDKINQIMAEAARKTELECGDGTTTTIFLTKLYYDLFRQYPGFIKRRYIEQFTGEIIDELRRRTVHVQVGDEMLRQVATITANQDTSIVDTVLGIYNDYSSPVVELKEGNEYRDKVSKVNGQKLRMAMADPIFSANRNGSSTEFRDVMFAVINANFSDARFSPSSVGAPLSELVRKYPEAHIGLVVNQASTTFCSAVVGVNKILEQQGSKSRFSVFSTNLGGSLGGLLMGDIASVLNSPLMSSLEDMLNNDLHVCEDVVMSTLTQSLILDISPATQQRIDARIADVQTTLDAMESSGRHSPMGKATEQRIQLLAGQIVTVYVGGETLSDIRERKDRFEDVALAVKSALTNGILPGCGVALRDAALTVYQNPKGKYPADIAKDILLTCTHQWAKLANVEQVDLDVYLERGFPTMITNLATGDVGTPEELGVYDTAYASITALKGGMTTAKILASTSSIILGNRAGAVHFDN